MVRTSFLLLALFPIAANGFSVGVSSTTSTTTRCVTSLRASERLLVDLPPSNSGLQAELRVEPVLDGPSEMIEVRYKIPFGLDVSPKDNLAVCGKDGPGGERAGDVLRYTSYWQLGLPRGDGLLSTAASFSGGVSWQCNMFDVMKAQTWQEVVEALTSNVAERTDEVVLIFERRLEQAE